MSLFSDSTQRHQWMLTRSDLAVRRRNARLRYDQERCAYQQSDPENGYLTLSEQDLLLYYYQRRIAEFAAGFSLPIQVIGTAMIYFRRFYLDRTVMDEDPRLIAISSLLLATKSEEAHIRAADLARSTEISTETLLQFEQIVLEGIRFHLKVHIPYRAIHGFIGELAAAAAGDLSKHDARAVLARAETQAKHALYTDALFLYTPSQIALVALQRAAKALRLKCFSDWFTTTLSSADDQTRLLLEAMKDIDEMIEAIVSRPLPTDTDTWAYLKHKRDQCRNLLRDPTSQIAQQHKHDLEKERDDRRLKKHLEVSSRSSSFLDSLTSNRDNNEHDEEEFALKTNPIKRQRRAG